ncbi:MAG: MerR family transcriptional regulator [Roseibium sp.]
MRIGDLAEKSGLTTDTLRYYEKIGLIPRPLRDNAGRRVYDVAILRWIDFLDRLKSTGMGIKDRLRYAELRTKGGVSLTPRREMLERHRGQVAADIARLTEMLDVLDDKIDLYRKMEAGDAVDPAFEHCARTEHGVQPSSKGPHHEHSTGTRTRTDADI